MTRLQLSVLDQSPVRQGGSAREALLATIALAQAADRLGYVRYWLAEHHNTGTLASASPEVLAAAVAAATSAIRVGTGGVMLTHYAALKVAEVFRLLEALYPGRIDMGLGRAPGSDGLTARALAHGPGALPLEAYPLQVADVLAYMTEGVGAEHPHHGIRAIPAGPGMPEPWLLGSAWDSARFAAEQGLGFSFAQFISPAGGERVVAEYRARFRPSPWLAAPRVSIAVSALCADTTSEARRLGMSRHLMRLRRQQGRDERAGVPTAEEALATEYTDAEWEYIRYQQSLAVEGEPEAVRGGLEELATLFETDEVMVVTITHDYAARARSYELLAQACGLQPRAVAHRPVE
ncbi:MAG: LLM class flavin-dependent oxidoreductase [Dehalococcoidia bacterium]|nr:LLM class flavin-dependent oxidoreductase [Dehalococcoidia bacterium]